MNNEQFNLQRKLSSTSTGDGGNYMNYADTKSFSKLVVDYVNGNEKLKLFYQHPVSWEGMQASIDARKLFANHREILVEELQKQYSQIGLKPLQELHLQQLLVKNTFTITTAHQPNIFTGPLYFIYKILHAIKLAAECKTHFPENNFVPVYYMGSEDADLDELGHINLDGEKLAWKTSQTGAVGRMHTKGLNEIINRLENEFGHLPFGKEMVEVCKKAYGNFSNIQQATLFLVNELFKDFGLLILIPDNANLKRVFSPIVSKELLEQFSHPLVEETNKKIGEHYKVQAGGRAINLFYLSDDGQRDRIEIRNKKYEILNKKISFSQEEILTELNNHPERFSANVILRGVFQETILPNIAFIGGGGELAYWLELKKVFEAVQVPYPMLVLRNSFLLIENRAKLLLQKTNISTQEIFEKEETIFEKLVKDRSQLQLSLANEKQQVENLFSQIGTITAAIDLTLQKHSKALQIKALQKLDALEKKMIRAEKRKYTDLQRQIAHVKKILFPQNNLQERVDNFMPYFAQYGPEFLHKLLSYSLGIEQQFGIIEL